MEQMMPQCCENERARLLLTDLQSGGLSGPGVPVSCVRLPPAGFSGSAQSESKKEVVSGAILPPEGSFWRRVELFAPVGHNWFLVGRG